MDPDQALGDSREEDVDMISLPASAGPDKDLSKGVETAVVAVPTSDAEGEDSSRSAAADETNLPIRTDDCPPVAEQVRIIETLLKQFAEKPPQEGDTAFLVSRRWLNRARAFGTSAKDAGKEALDGPPGPVDNSDIIDSIFTDANGLEFVKLKPGIGLAEFELFPKPAWDSIVSWYGLSDGQKPIIRAAHNTAPDSISEPNIQYEFYPPVLTVHRLWSAVSPLPIEQQLKLRNPPPAVIVHSTSYRFHDFLKEAKKHAGIPLSQKVRLWKVLQTLPAAEPSQAAPQSGISTPPDSPGRQPTPAGSGSWPHLLLEVDQFLRLEKGVERDTLDVRDTTHHEGYNGGRSLATVDLNVDQTLVLDEQIDPGTFVSNFSPGMGVKGRTLAKSGSSASLAAQSRASTNGRNSPVSLGPVTRGRAQRKSGQTIGCVGLQNLGNTCYMNSALQCVRSVEELTKYFLTHEAEKEINPDNPLSHNGDVARAYGRLLEEIYRDPPPTAVAPRQFKNVIGRYAPSFSGYGQQDSQEFLGFLLDGLQEDLNRIKKKPYIEKPDSTDDMIHNPAAIREMADKVWDITKKRDDSVIADLFTGMYKSTLVCPVCSKVSITFDPFTNLTLPLPVGKSWTGKIKYYPLNDAPVFIPVEVDKNATFKVLKEYLSSRVGVPPARLFAAEEFRNKFFKLYDDLSSISEEVQGNDIVAVHELEAPPTNVTPAGARKAPGKQKYRSLLDPDPTPWVDPMSERMAVPIIHRSDESSNKRKTRSFRQPTFLPPHFILLTREEACNEDIIRRKILEKVATFSTWTELSKLDDSDATEATDAEIVTSTSDADSAGDSNVVAKSVEGEEGLVDITMNESSSHNPPKSSAGYGHLLKKFNTRRPKWIDPDYFLNPAFQNLFELSYFSDGDATTIPSGWSSVQEDRPLPSLSTRVPKKEDSPEDVQMQSPATWPGSEDSGSDETAPPEEVNAPTRMVDESSEEDPDLPEFQNAVPPPRVNGNRFNQPNNKGKKKMKSHRTYGKRGAKRLAKQMHALHHRHPTPELPEPQPEVGSEPDYGALVRLGEGIVVDWNDKAFDCVFGGEPDDDMRGKPTFLDPEQLQDPLLEAKKSQRQVREKNGITLDDCLDEFEKEEILSEQDTWYCPRCKEHRRASKKFDLWKTPDILAVHLKRFSSAGWRREKIDVLVDFPVEGLDLSKRVINKETGKQEVYDLIAVDDHWGGLGGGHYTAFAKNFIDGEWYNYNDTSVSKLNDPSKVVTKAAYLLFYRRRSDVPLGGPRFQEILERYEHQTANEDNSDSGEVQRLGHGSSRLGSSSALVGAGRTLHDEARGLASGYTDGLGRSLRADSDEASKPPPPYSEINDILEGDDADDDSAALTSTSEIDLMGFGASPPPRSLGDPGEDEGVDMDPYPVPSGRQSTVDAMTNAMTTNWNFSALEVRNSSGVDDILDDDIASNIAQNDSSDDLNDMDLTSEDPTRSNSEYASVAQGDGDLSQFELPPPPTHVEQAHLSGISGKVWDQLHEVPATMPEDQASDKVDEIHVGDEGW